jgi:hypothetical protein
MQSGFGVLVFREPWEVGMDPQVKAAIVGGICVVVSALLTNYREEILNLFSSSRQSKDMKGTWRSSWTIMSPGGASPNLVEDQVTISKARGRNLRGEGVTPGKGKWRVDGRVTPYVVTLDYRGSGDNKDLVGVVILKRQTDRMMEGVWCQYTSSGALQSGSTQWQKIA